MSGEEPSVQLKDLYVRREICLLVLRVLEEAKDDPRYESAKELYQGQLNNINAKIDAFKEKPPDIVIGLKTAVLDLKRR